MRKTFKWLLAVTVIAGGLQFTSCKSKKTTETTPDQTTIPQDTQTQAPVIVAPDDALTTGVRDAVKDYPGVNAAVNNGEITLTGEIERARLQPLMQSLNTLRPKKINNNLTIK